MPEYKELHFSRSSSVSWNYKKILGVSVNLDRNAKHRIGIWIAWYTCFTRWNFVFSFKQYGLWMLHFLFIWFHVSTEAQRLVSCDSNEVETIIGVHIDPIFHHIRKTAKRPRKIEMKRWGWNKFQNFSAKKMRIWKIRLFWEKREPATSRGKNQT